jgi:hypothetical protein
MINDPKCQIRLFPRTMEMTMRNLILRALLVLLIASLTAEAATASERYRVRVKARTVASEQWRNSNAYSAPAISWAPSYGSNLAEGAMTSGMAGH